MNDDLFHAAIRTLAEIDTALGLPDDGCNSPQRTLQAIHRMKNAHEQVAHWTEQFQRAMKRAEQAEARAAEWELVGVVIRTSAIPPEREWKDEITRKTAIRALGLHKDVARYLARRSAEYAQLVAGLPEGHTTSEANHATSYDAHSDALASRPAKGGQG